MHKGRRKRRGAAGPLDRRGRSSHAADGLIAHGAALRVAGPSGLMVPVRVNATALSATAGVADPSPDAAPADSPESCSVRGGSTENRPLARSEAAIASASPCDRTWPSMAKLDPSRRNSSTRKRISSGRCCNRSRRARSPAPAEAAPPTSRRSSRLARVRRYPAGTVHPAARIDSERAGGKPPAAHRHAARQAGRSGRRARASPRMR